MRLPFVAFVALVLAGCAAPGVDDDSQQTGPPKFSIDQVAVIPPSAGFAMEPHVAMHPTDQDILVAASADLRRGPGGLEDRLFEIVVHRSEDGGSTWKSAVLPPTVRSLFDRLGSMNVAGDPVLAYSPNGDVFLVGVAAQAVWKEGPNGIGVTQLNHLTVFVTKSNDDGESWGPALFFRQGAGTFGFPVVFAGLLEDKPWITTGRDGSVHVTWTEFIETQSAIRYANSMDGGSTWSEPLLLALSKPGLETGPVQAQFPLQGSTVSAPGDGLVFVSATEYPTTQGSEQKPEAGGSQLVWVSNDGGATFGPPARAGRSTYARYGQVVGNPLDPERVVVVAPTDSEDSRVYLVQSHDAGETWSDPVFLSERDGVQQHPTAAWAGDRLLVAFYDAGWAGGERVTMILSDGTHVLETVGVPETIDPGPYRREYFGLAGYGSDFAVVYVGGDAQTGTWISHARVSLAP
jgi:hypothetical protein